MNTPIIEVRNLSKTFVLHQQGGVAIEALSGISFSVDAGECVALHGPSGAGKSTLLRALYGNYLPTGGSIRVRCGGEDVDITSAAPRTVIRLRRGSGDMINYLLSERIGESIDLKSAEILLRQLAEQEKITADEAGLMYAALTPQALSVPIPESLKDNMRAKILRSMLLKAARKAIA